MKPESLKIRDYLTFVFFRFKSDIFRRFPRGLQRLTAGRIVDQFGLERYQKKYKDQCQPARTYSKVFHVTRKVVCQKFVQYSNLDSLICSQLYVNMGVLIQCKSLKKSFVTTLIYWSIKFFKKSISRLTKIMRLKENQTLIVD